jgi:bifunctional non-homologous end joining protein LigD
MFPEDKLTREDIFEYYKSVWKYLKPHLKDRPIVQNLFFGNIHEHHEFVMDAGNSAPDWVDRYTMDRKSGKTDTISYVLCHDIKTLEYLIMKGNVDINTWGSRYQTPENPDFLVVDLDPSDANSFDDVVNVALAFKALFDELNIRALPKTSGSTGLHIYIPVAGKYTYAEGKQHVLTLCRFINKLMPGLTTMEVRKAKRGNRIYLDAYQNIRVNTMACVYSVRPKLGAPVSTPLLWEEVKSGLHPSDFTVKNINKRLEKVGDLFKPVLGKGVDLLNRLNNFTHG